MKSIFVENVIKNILLIVILVFAYPSIQTSFSSVAIVSDKTVIGNLLVAVSIIAVIACFGNFTFTYEKIDKKDYASRLLAHVTTGILMLLIGLSLEMTSILANHLVDKGQILTYSFFLLYIASMLYDFWDLKRAAL